MTGEPQRAVALLEQVVSDIERVLGPNNLDTYANRGNLAHWLWEQTGGTSPWTSTVDFSPT